MNMTSIIKNVAPAIAVMVAGLVGAYTVYDFYFSDNITAAQVQMYQPAAGGEISTLGQGFSMIEPAAGGDILGSSFEAELNIMTGTTTEMGTVINSNAPEEVSLEEVSEIIEKAIQ